MSAEAPKNTGIDAEIDKFIPDKLRELEAEREKDREVREKSYLESLRKEQERRTFLETGNNRATEIIQESGLREILEQARISLARYYPSATIAERKLPGDYAYDRREDSKILYQFRLGWKPVPESTRINIWDPHELGDGEEFHYLDVRCSGWKENVTYVPETRTYENMGFSFTREEERPIYSYERRDSLVIFYGLPGGIELLNDEWRNSEKVKQVIVEAIKNPWIEKVPYVMHDRPVPFGEHYR
ncbi:hypothetical protein HYZ05_02195 [Candidatus Daviesbacteria bacterium]|nr:hypothetical protein [Candidatus Daviesbacteria bacterium]